MLFIVTKENYRDLKNKIKDLETKKTIAEQDRDFSRSRESQGRDTIKKLNTKILELEERIDTMDVANCKLRTENAELKKQLRPLKKIISLFNNKTAKLSEIKKLVINDTTKAKSSKKALKNKK